MVVLHARHYDALAQLERALATLTRLRSAVAFKLPIDGQGDRLAGIRDRLDQVERELTSARDVLTVEVSRLEKTGGTEP
jgi:hypothetical protein